MMLKSDDAPSRVSSVTRRSGTRRRALWLAVVVTIVLGVGWTIAIVPATSSAVSITAEDEGGGEPAAEPEPAPAPAASSEPSAEASAEPTDDATADPSTEASAEESATPEESSDEAASDEAADDEAASDEAADDEAADDEAADDEAASDELTDESTGQASDEAIIAPVEPTPSPTAASSGITITIDGAIGSKAGAVVVSVNGVGAAPAAQYSLWVFSSPQLLATGQADAAGMFTASAPLPATLPPGSHTVVLNTTGADGEAIESATGITISADGTLEGVVPNVDASALVVPVISDNPKAPKFAPVAPLDNPAAVVTTAIAGLTVATVAGAAAGMGGSGGSGGGSGGGSRGGAGGDEGGGLEAEVRRRKKLGRHERSGEVLDDEKLTVDGLWDARFVPEGTAIGDNSWLYRAPGLAVMDSITYRSVAAMAPKSPLLSRCLGDGAPIQAMFGSLSVLLPLAGIVVGTIAGFSVDGIAQPAAIGIMATLILIGIFDAFAGILAAVAFTLVVAFSGGIIDASSVRTLAGIGLLIVGPGVIGGSFRDIRRPSVAGSVEVWERLTDLVVVPLLGAWVTYNIVGALPGLGGAAFPIADSALLLAYVVLGGLVAKILLEEAAARWFPERMDALTPDEPDQAPNSQRIISAFLRMGTFAFVSAAFVGNVWQLWAASLLFVVPALTEVVADRFPNSPRLWQVLPEGVPLITFMLVIGWVVSAALVTSLGDSPDYAQTMFFILAVPGFVLALLGVVGRDPREGDTRWYQRPSMTPFYRIGGIAVLIATTYLAFSA